MLGRENSLGQESAQLPSTSCRFDAHPLKGPGCRRVTSMRSLPCVCRFGSMKVSYSKHSGLVALLRLTCDNVS